MQVAQQSTHAAPHYTMIIQWSDEDEAYLVTLPDWNSLPLTHGETYEQAVVNGMDALEALVAARQQAGEALPVPKAYAFS